MKKNGDMMSAEAPNIGDGVTSIFKELKIRRNDLDELSQSIKRLEKEIDELKKERATPKGSPNS